MSHGEINRLTERITKLEEIIKLSAESLNERLEQLESLVENDDVQALVEAEYDC